uniref:Thioredoxin domain-containing protein n=1 Tax=Ditylenchus dipsaci TaxID=166011 RepID=A0A915CRW0_9BILA
MRTLILRSFQIQFSSFYVGSKLLLVSRRSEMLMLGRNHSLLQMCWKNPSNSFKTDERLKVSCIPTLLQLNSNNRCLNKDEDFMDAKTICFQKAEAKLHKHSISP